MAELATLARPYALAVFGLAKDSNALGAWAEQLRNLALVAQDATAKAVLDSPKFDASKKLSVFTSVIANLGDTAKNLVSTLIERDRVALLPAIAVQFDSLKNIAENIAVANVRTAMPLSDAQKSGLQAALAKRFGKTITLAEQVDAGLIAGAIISIGDNVIDGSASGRLASLTTELSTS
jgi:F-type H+-transporting ATPase subunit delta